MTKYLNSVYRFIKIAEVKCWLLASLNSCYFCDIFHGPNLNGESNSYSGQLLKNSNGQASEVNSKDEFSVKFCTTVSHIIVKLQHGFYIYIYIEIYTYIVKIAN